MQSMRALAGEHIVAMRPTEHSLPNGLRHAGPQALIRRFGRGLLPFRPLPVTPSFVLAARRYRNERCLRPFVPFLEH